MLTVRRFFATLGPGTLWLAAFLIVPALVMLGYSFLTRTDLAQVGGPWTLENWGRVFGYDALFQEWTADNARVLWRSVWVAGLSTALCVLMGYPLAFYIARQDARRKNLLLLLLIIPFWTNFLIRVYAWILILRPFDLVPSLSATLLGMVYAFVPFFVLPVYSSVEKIDWRLLEAAQDLGAPPAGLHDRRVPADPAGPRGGHPADLHPGAGDLRGQRHPGRREDRAGREPHPEPVRAGRRLAVR
ncbi:ABC transporter permease [Deinococcus caeni]|uniref:ABC transporter permease n=1 Tax=Deinococcus caeni TaxID=569127 RepID=UPI003616F69E